MLMKDDKNKADINIIHDKVMVEIYNKNVYLNDFKFFPKVIVGSHGNIEFIHYLKHRSAKNVNESRMEYFQ